MVQQFPRLRSLDNAGIFASRGQDFFERVRSVIKLRAAALPISGIAAPFEIKILREQICGRLIYCKASRSFGFSLRMKIELRGVVKSYNSVRALDRVSLQIDPGQIVSL